MIPYRSFLRGSSVPVITTIAIFALVLGIGAVGRKSAIGSRAQSESQRIQNRTRSFEVTETSLNSSADGGAELSFRNGYDKYITAYTVSVNGSITEIDFLYSDFKDQEGIAPKTVYTKNFFFARPANPALSNRQKLEINVIAVVFDDKTGDGDPRLVAQILAARQESKIQIMRIIDLLNKALDSPGILKREISLDSVKSEISSLPTNSQHSSEKEDALLRLDRLNSLNSQKPKESIRHLKETYESLVARL